MVLPQDVPDGEKPEKANSGCRGNNKSRSKDAVETKAKVKATLSAKRVQEGLDEAGDGFGTPKKAVSAPFPPFWSHMAHYGPY